MKNEKTQHTPGPWKIDRWKGARGEQFIQVNGAPEDRGSLDAMTGRPTGKERQIVARLGDARFHTDTIEANARLIAAAPDLLEAARLLNQALFEDGRQIDLGDPVQSAIQSIRAAIAKAEGR